MMATPRVLMFSWGPNSYGQLGTGDKEDKLLPTPVNFEISHLEPPENGSDGPIRQLTGGGGHTMIVTYSGGLYSMGLNDRGQLGLGHTLDTCTPTHVDFFATNQMPVAMVACGWAHTLALTVHGSVYSFGCNKYGQLGQPIKTDHSYTPTVIEALAYTKVQKVAAGLRHSVCLTEEGKVYAWGCGRHGQLGQGQGTKQALVSILVSLPEPVVDIAAGYQQTLLLAANGEVFSFGNNKYGQCLPGDSTKHVWQPSCNLIGSLVGEPIKSIHSGWSHACAVTVSGKVWLWGRSDYGQITATEGADCGQSEDIANNQNRNVPVMVGSLTGARQICLGAEHAIAINESGDCVAWGWNEHGPCGNGSTENVLVPTKVVLPKDIKVSLVGVGYGHSMALCEVRV